jgi:hypothetical protein
MVLKAAAREALSQPPDSGDQVVVGVPGSWMRCRQAIGRRGRHVVGGVVRRADAGGQEARVAWPGHMAMVPVQGL